MHISKFTRSYIFLGTMETAIDEAHLRFKHPCTILAAGPTGSGKTVLVRKILQYYNDCFESISAAPKIIWCYGQLQSSYLDNVGNGVDIQYHEGLIDEEAIDAKRPDIVVVDDLMNELGGDDALVNLFTKGSHHLNLTVIFIVQNVFHKGPHMRTISLNSHYMILLKNPRDKSQIINLARQLYPTKTRFLQEAFNDATSKPFGYLVLDLKSDTPEAVRCRAEIIPAERETKGPLIYTPKGRKGEFVKHVAVHEEHHTPNEAPELPKLDPEPVKESPLNEETVGGIKETEVLAHPQKEKRAIRKTKPKLKSTKKSSSSSQSGSGNVDGLKRCLYQLDTIARIKDSRRRQSLLKELSTQESVQRAVCELARSTRNCEIPLTTVQKKALVRYNNYIQKCADTTVSGGARQKAVSQSGGWLNIVVPALLSLLFQAAA